MDMEMLIKSHNPLIAVETREEERLEEIVRHIAARLNLPLYIWDCTNGIRRFDSDAALYNTSDIKAALATIADLDNGIFLLKDLKFYLREVTIERALKETVKEFTSQKSIILLTDSAEFPSGIQEILITYPLPLPDKVELNRIVEHLAATLPNVKVELSAEDKNMLLENLRGLTAFEAKRALSQAVLNQKLDKNDISLLADIKKRTIEKDNLVEYISPDDNLTVVGGLTNLKEWISVRKTAFSDERFNLPAPKGVLLVGVPGCGKTLCARAIAHEFAVGLIKLDAGKLYKKYIGESEETLRRVLKTAESLAPVVFLIDEVEKALPSVDSGINDGGLSLRLFGTFLSWLQEKDDSVFVVATCNNIRSLPPEFSRKGRFDELFFVDLPNSSEREEIIGIHLKRRAIDPSSIDIETLATMSSGFSGAELEQLILSSLYSAAYKSVSISTEIIVNELKKIIPLSKRESARIDALRAWAAENTIKA